MGFSFAYKLSGGAPTIVDLPLKAATVTKVGRIVNLESGYIDEAAANDHGLVGIALEAQDNTSGGNGALSAKCIIDPDAVYAVVDASARVAGETLDVASSGDTVGATVQADLIVVAPSTATEDTLIRIVGLNHYLTAAV